MPNILSHLRVDTSVVRTWLSQRSQIASFATTDRLSDTSETRPNYGEGFPHKTLRQGHILDPVYRATQRDPHAEAARSGFAARKNLGFEHPYEAASPRRGTRFATTDEERKGSGNPEGVGFADQVGGQSAAVGVFSRK
ncbi:hypothetical protein SCHPADRAFT_938998 [Schizopora paradoxa]|uniref:Uncharacterized protein n=1 Tax=Schizopora paradoxa TaxID=27342 RepID=A0A0H2RTH4_9AGAM|nr:hypothetical protein SCHPADRAFT_938998 [Schizopora paradoxa]